MEDLLRPNVEPPLTEDAGSPSPSPSEPSGSDGASAESDGASAGPGGASGGSHGARAAPEEASASPGLHRPARRTYAPIVGGRRDVDAFERVARFRVLSWSLVGAFLGLLSGVFLWAQGRPGWIVFVTLVIGWAVTFFGPLLILRGAGRAGSVLYTPSGRTTPRKREYSLAESYVARGEHRAAVDAFEEAVLEDSADPRPYLRIARIYRDELADPEAAARWFKRALSESEMPGGLTLLTRKELVELYRVRLGEPRRAAPVLAKIAEDAAGTPDGAWAAAELARIKAEMATGADTP